jgi:hypothetical protein
LDRSHRSSGSVTLIAWKPRRSRRGARCNADDAACIPFGDAWAQRDLNSRPPGYQPGAPASLSYGPAIPPNIPWVFEFVWCKKDARLSAGPAGERERRDGIGPVAKRHKDYPPQKPSDLTMVPLYEQKKVSFADIAFKGWFSVVLLAAVCTGVVLLARGLMPSAGATPQTILAFRVLGIIGAVSAIVLLIYALKKRDRINRSVVIAILSGMPQLAETVKPPANPLAPPLPVQKTPVPAPVVQYHPAVPPPLPLYIPMAPAPMPPGPSPPYGAGSPVQPVDPLARSTLERVPGGFFAEFLCPACGMAIRNRPVGVYLTCEHCGETGHIQ